MEEKEIQSLIEQLKATGLNEEEIMDVFYKAFTDGEMDRKDLETLSEYMGYELTDDFKNDPQPDPIAGGNDGNDGNASKEQIEEAKEIKPGESEEEFKDKIGIDGDGGEGENEEKPEPESDDDDKEWDEAQKMFKI